jgi:hypothetical protein
MHDTKKGKVKDPDMQVGIDDGCFRIKQMYYGYKERFEKRYEKFSPNNKDGLEWKHWWSHR